MSKPRLIVETEITQYGRRKPTTLRLDLAACREAMAELARAERMLLAAAAAADEPAEEASADAAGDEPVPDIRGSLCWCGHVARVHNTAGQSGGRGFCAECEPGRCGRYEPARREPRGLEPAAGPAPHHAGPGEARCEAYDDDNGEGWLCTAQAGHGGPVHLAYGQDGTVARRWPCGQDPYDPETMPQGYCTACGGNAGHFTGYDGPRHYRGEGTVASPVELVDAGHEPVLAWRYPEPAAR